MYYHQSLTPNEGFRLIKSRIKNEQILSEELDISEIDLSNKSIVVLCGNGTKTPLRATDYSKYCFGWLKNFKNKSDVTIYSVFYPREQPLLPTLRPNLRLDYYELTKAIFEQIMLKSGKLQSLQEISRQLNNITFFGHSAGGFVMNELMFYFGSMLQSHGFSDKDINKVYSKIVFIGYSPYALVDAPINSIYVAPIHDSVGSTKLVYDRMIQNKKVISSNSGFDISNTCKLRASNYSSFFRLYKTAINNGDTLYFIDNKSLISTPNHLFVGNEDHNLAGVIEYAEEHPLKTRAGRLTSKFLNNVFCYSLSNKREKFSITELYKQAIQEEKQEEKQADKEIVSKYKEL